jgi:hypothetical protein
MVVPSALTMLCLVVSSSSSPLIASRTVFSLIPASFANSSHAQFGTRFHGDLANSSVLSRRRPLFYFAGRLGTKTLAPLVFFQEFS